MVSPNYQTYKNLVKQNWVAGNINESKAAMLNNLRKTLRISDEEHELILAELKKDTFGGPTPPAQAPASTPSSTPPLSRPQPTAQAPATPDPSLQTPRPAPSSFQPGVRTLESAVREKPPEPASPAGMIRRVGPEPAPAPASTPPQMPQPAAVPKKDDGEMTPEKCLEMGKEAYRNGDFKLSYDLCDKALKMRPNNSQALFFKKRAKSKLDESGQGGAPAAEAHSDPMLSHMSASTPEPAKTLSSSLPRCLSCRDTKICSWCKATGSCWMCHGTALCSNCKGNGTVNEEPCVKCKGSGKCDSCLGSGKCYWCKGTGKCHKCNK